MEDIEPFSSCVWICAVNDDRDLEAHRPRKPVNGHWNLPAKRVRRRRPTSGTLFLVYGSGARLSDQRLCACRCAMASALQLHGICGTTPWATSPPITSPTLLLAADARCPMTAPATPDRFTRQADSTAP